MRIVLILSIFAAAAGGIILAYAIFAFARFPVIEAPPIAQQYLQIYATYESYDNTSHILSVSAYSPYDSSIIPMSIHTREDSLSLPDRWETLRQGDPIRIQLKRNTTPLTATAVNLLQ